MVAALWTVPANQDRLRGQWRQIAERYRAYKTELRDLDLWKAAHRFLELGADADRVRRALHPDRQCAGHDGRQGNDYGSAHSDDVG